MEISILKMFVCVCAFLLLCGFT